jgi:phosphopantothenoylcysteine synthetase/decarboxylase
MNILVTAGNTLVPIDQVRCITNIFTGRTGTRIALASHNRGHEVTLLTSQPDLLGPSVLTAPRWTLQPYSTFTDLQEHLARFLATGRFHVLIHSAAVSDYQAGGIYAPATHTRFHPEDGSWESRSGEPAALVDRAAAKVKSAEPELWLRLVRAPKLVDCVRTKWAFRGILVKFKLEAGVTETKLLEAAEASRRQSDADLMVANTLEGKNDWAFLGPINGGYERVNRSELPNRLLAVVERLYEERPHG